MTFGSLFAGIGGFDLGLERAGMRCSWQVEKDPFARRVLAKHWPDVRRWDDVKTFPPPPVEDWSVDLICGGFPCQDVSNAGKRAGIGGERSGLWAEFARIVGVVRPRLVVVENVAALLGRGIDRVLGDLAVLGFDAEWSVVPASALGAAHLRDRVFIVAHAQRPRLAIRPCLGGDAREELAALERGHRSGAGVWASEPRVRRVAHGVPDRVHRLECLGNAIVPQVSEFIGRRIVESLR